MRIVFWFVTISLLFSARTEAVDLTASGGVVRQIDSSQLAAGIGSDLIATYIDDAAATLNITSADSQVKWRIDVRRIDATWNNNLKVCIKRLNGGSGDGTVAGGLAFIEVTDSGGSFITGTGTRSGISLSYELTGMSVAIRPNVYSTIVTFAAVIIP